MFAGQIESDHSLLLKKLENAESKIKDWLQRQEKKRNEAIAEALKELESYKAVTAEAFKKANDTRNHKIAKAKKSLSEFDETISVKVEKWELDHVAGKSKWSDLDLSDISSKMPGVKFEDQKDGSVFVGGRSAKGSYIIESSTMKSQLTGLRIEAMSDNRLPKKGPGRAPNDGNFVLTELDVLASPTKDLSHWAEVGDWQFSKAQITEPWAVGPKTSILESNNSIVINGEGKEVSLQSSSFYHIGPFKGLGFDQEGGPERESTFDPDKKFAFEGTNLSWKVRPDWKEGVLHGTVISAENSSNYLLKDIETSHPATLPISLGSDVGIKVFLNGKQVFANNVGRGAAPDQEKLVLNLEAGKNILLLKIHNGGGPSGFYYKSGIEEAISPSISLIQNLPAASYVLLMKANAKEEGFARVQWGNEQTESESIQIEGPGNWVDCRIQFAAQKAFNKMQIFFQNGTKVRSVKILKNGLPIKLSFENALATFSQRGYSIASAVDGKVEPAANGWAISPQMGRSHFASFQVKSPVTYLGPTNLKITMKQEFQSGQHSLGRFRVAVTDAAKPISYGLPEEVTEIFAVVLLKS